MLSLTDILTYPRLTSGFPQNSLQANRDDFSCFYSDIFIGNFPLGVLAAVNKVQG